MSHEQLARGHGDGIREDDYRALATRLAAMYVELERGEEDT